MTSLIKGIVIVGAKRTPFGKFGGKLSNIAPTDLQTIAGKAALVSANVNPELVDTVTIGNVLAGATSDTIFIAKHVALKCGIPIEKPALAINRLCGSGFQSIVNSVQDITMGVAQICLAGGAENMSLAPFVIRNVRFGTKFGEDRKLEDSLWDGNTDTNCGLSMALTAEKLGAQYKLTREEVDEFSLRSQKLYKAARDAGKFKDEIVPVPVKLRKQNIVVDVDEHPRPDTTLEVLARLPTIFKENGLVTAGSASGVCDGAAAVVVASEEAAIKHNLKPLARLVAYSTVGVDPSIMGIGPVPAIQKILKITGKTLNDIDLIEINEAFAAQAVACMKELKLDINKLNVNGGAVSLGHPLAASGSRIMGHLAYELRRRKGKYAIGSACIGGGQGIAIMIEAL